MNPDSKISETTVDRYCDLCGSKSSKDLRQENGYPIVQCADCSLIYVSKIPIVVGDKVIGEYYSGSEEEIIVNQKRYSVVSQYLVSTIDKLLPGRGRLLDVGCGFGFFLKEAKAKGWEVYGTDLSEVSIEYAKTNNKLSDVWSCELSDLPVPRGYFSAINLTNVLEHVPSPLKMLRDCKDQLQHGGYIFVRVPNVAFFRFIERFRPLLKLLGINRDTSILATEPPVHLTGLSPHTLNKYFEKAGLKTVYIRPSKLSTAAKESILFTFFEYWVNLLYKVSFSKINLSPTVLAVAVKK